MSAPARLLRGCLAVLAASTTLAEAKTTDFSYNATGSLGSPWVGLVPYYPDTSAGSFPHSMENFYVSMASLMSGWGKYTFENFTKQLDEVAARKHQVICRVYLDYPGKNTKPTDGVPKFLVDGGLKFYKYQYTPGVSPDWEDANLRRAMTELIEQLGKQFDGDNRIAFWQVGFLGQWGEWHDPGNAQGGPQWASKTVQTEVLRTFNSSFKTTPLLVRYPDVTGNYTPAEINIGFHDDSYAQDTIGNVTWDNNSWHFLTRLVKSNATDRWQHVPIGGELRPEFQKCAFAVDAVDTCKIGGLRYQDFNTCTQTTHASWQWDNQMGSYSADNGDLGRAYAATAAMGYRFFVPQIEVTTSADALGSASVSVSVHIQNTGVAPCYYPAHLLVTYPCSASKNCTKSFGPDLRTLLPSKTSTVAVTSVPVPASLLDETKGVSVGVSVDTEGHALTPVRFAVSGAGADGMLWASSA